MRFDKFVKHVGIDGMILKAENGDKWLWYGNVGMKIPENKNVSGVIHDMPEWLEDVIYNEDVKACELKRAYVPFADSKPSELLREFANNLNMSIAISNKTFGFIERSDKTDICEFEVSDDKHTALLVADEFSYEDEFQMCVIDDISKI